MMEGELLKEFGIAAVSKSTPEDWRESCDKAIAELAATGRAFTADDIRRLVGDPPNHPNAMGARFVAAAKAGILRKVGYQSPLRASRHASVVAIWRGKDGF